MSTRGTPWLADCGVLAGSSGSIRHAIEASAVPLLGDALQRESAIARRKRVGAQAAARLQRVQDDERPGQEGCHHEPQAHAGPWIKIRTVRDERPSLRSDRRDRTFLPLRQYIV